MDPLRDELIPTRETLLARLKDWRDQASWQAFFDTYWGLIYGVATKGGLTTTEAEDVVQETMISVAKHMPDFKYARANGSFKTWLLNMTRWRMADQFRKRNQHGSSVESLPDGEDGETGQLSALPELEQVWDREWEDNLLHIAVTAARRKLDPFQYQIFDCYANKRWPAEKVAKTCAVPVGQVYLAKHRVTEAIRQEVERLRKDLI
jgi:RNA polymerase sigma-70 factor (ECF subfamily)